MNHMKNIKGKVAWHSMSGLKKLLQFNGMKLDILQLNEIRLLNKKHFKRLSVKLNKISQKINELLRKKCFTYIFIIIFSQYFDFLKI